MNKAELVAELAKKSDLKKTEAEKVLKAFVETVTAELKAGGKVQLVGFGTFETVKRAKRQGQNPQTKAKITIPASNAPKFKAGKALKEAVNSKKKK